MNSLAAMGQRLEALRSQHGPTHPEVIEQQMALAERTGREGNPREAADLYQVLGDALRARLGPHDARTLDAYEGFVRWVEVESPPDYRADPS